MEPNDPHKDTAKKLKIDDSKEQRNADRISDLPDHLLCKILYSFDMKKVVQTSFLSTRWRYIWTSVRILNFNSILFLNSYKRKVRGFDRFMEFVDDVFIHRDDSHVEKIFLYCNDQRVVLTRRVYSWLRAAVQQHVQDLDFRIPYIDSSLSLPLCLFTCDSLKVLKLCFGTSQIWLRLPKLVSLPALKVLHLESIRFVGEIRTSELFSGSPLLESLVIVRCHFCSSMLKTLIICTPKLKDLVIEYDVHRESYSTEGFPTIQISAPSLLRLKVKDHFGRDYIIGSLSSIVNVDIDMEKEDTKDLDDGTEVAAQTKKGYAERAMKFIGAFQNARALTVSPLLLEAVSYSPFSQWKSLSLQFDNLRVMKLKTWLCPISIRAINYLLNVSPNVESLLIEVVQGHFWTTTTITKYEDAEFPLQCMNHLKLVKIGGILRCINGLIFLKALLEKALILKEVVIYTSKKARKDEKWMELKENVRQITAASSNVSYRFRASNPRE
ncbi:hypothetical protein ACHQM5_003401 [Ranunculus cassubicifolius]